MGCEHCLVIGVLWVVLRAQGTVNHDGRSVVDIPGGRVGTMVRDW